MNKVEQFYDLLEDEAIRWDGLDECIIGASSDGKVVYDIKKMITHFQAEGLSRENAIEHIDYNILGAYVGELTPIHIYTYE